MEAPAEELEVVAHDEEWADDDEGQQPRADPRQAEQAQRDGAQEAGACGQPERGVGDGGAQGMAVDLVERVCGNADGAEEREHRRHEADGVGVGSERRADDDVGEMPGGVGRVEKRPPVPPPSGRGGVEGGPAVALSHVCVPTSPCRRRDS